MIPEACSSVVEQMADALVYADTQGRICGWNAAAERLFGFSRAEAIGNSLDLIIPERLRAAHWAAFDRAMASSATRLDGRPTITRSLTGRGETIYVEMTFAVVNDDQGKALGSVAIARDATQRHQEDRRLRERLAELEKNSQ